MINRAQLSPAFCSRRRSLTNCSAAILLSRPETASFVARFCSSLISCRRPRFDCETGCSRFISSSPPVCAQLKNRLFPSPRQAPRSPGQDSSQDPTLQLIIREIISQFRQKNSKNKRFMKKTNLPDRQTDPLDANPLQPVRCPHAMLPARPSNAAYLLYKIYKSVHFPPA